MSHHLPVRRISLIVGAAALICFGVGLSGPVNADTGGSDVSFTSWQVGTSATTAPFTEPSPWTMSWQFDCSDYANGGSFKVAINRPPGDSTVDAVPDQSGHGNETGSADFSDTGTFSITVSSACFWILMIHPAAPPQVQLGIPERAAFSTQMRTVGIASDPGGLGFWTVQAGGNLEGYSDAVLLGGPALLGLNSPVVAIAAARNWYGYDLVGSDGGVFDYGGGFYGSTGGMKLNQPVVGMALTSEGGGYWLVARDGGVFSFGDALFLGSLGAVHLNAPVVGMASYNGGYTLVAADGGVFNYGTSFLGSLGSVHLDKPIVGIAQTSDGTGYWMVASDGGVFNFGDAGFFGSGVGAGKTIVGMAPTPDGGGYWLAASDGTVLNFGDAAPANAG
jgi:hypothetical protein